MPGFLRNLFTPSLRDQLEAGVRDALKRYADRRVAPDLRVYVTTDLLPERADAELWARDEQDHLSAFARQWAQDNGIPRSAIRVEVVLLDTKREFAFVKPLGLEGAPGEGQRMEASAPAAREMEARLEVVASPTRREPLTVRQEVVLGRKDAPGVTAIGDRYMSGRHARLGFRGGRLEVTDLDSKNRTFLNGEAISPNEPHPLSVGDSLRMGETELRVSDILA